mmetsp:Transcript_50368/g.139481  ORF Transcript_50368/g.139481 Transcript_50368/m.139481 type:complete len:205 (+) Transcript_50368:269-883(+)
MATWTRALASSAFVAVGTRRRSRAASSAQPRADARIAAASSAAIASACSSCSRAKWSHACAPPAASSALDASSRAACSALPAMSMSSAVGAPPLWGNRRPMPRAVCRRTWAALYWISWAMRRTRSSPASASSREPYCACSCARWRSWAWSHSWRSKPLAWASSRARRSFSKARSVWSRRRRSASEEWKSCSSPACTSALPSVCA